MCEEGRKKKKRKRKERKDESGGRWESGGTWEKKENVIYLFIFLVLHIAVFFKNAAIG